MLMLFLSFSFPHLVTAEQFARDAFYFLGRHDTSDVVYTFSIERVNSTTSKDTGNAEFNGVLHWKNVWFFLEPGKYPITDFSKSQLPLHPAYDFHWPDTKAQGEFFYHYNNLSISLVFNEPQPVYTLVNDAKEKSDLYIANATMQGQSHVIKGVLLIHRQWIDNWVVAKVDSSVIQKKKKKVNPMASQNTDDMQIGTGKKTRNWKLKTSTDTVEKAVTAPAVIDKYQRYAKKHSDTSAAALKLSDSSTQQLEKQKDSIAAIVAAQQLEKEKIEEQKKIDETPQKLLFLNALGGQTYLFWQGDFFPGKNPKTFSLKIDHEGAISTSQDSINMKVIVSDTTYEPAMEMAWQIENANPQLLTRLDSKSASSRTRKARYFLVEGKGQSDGMRQRLMGMMLDVRNRYEIANAAKSVDRDLQEDIKIEKPNLIIQQRPKPEVNKSLPWQKNEGDTGIPQELMN